MKELLRKKSVKIALFLIVFLVGIGIAGINAQSVQKRKEYNRHIEAAEKYLSELDYEQAIAEYTLALEIENKKETLDALGKVYLAYAQTFADAGDYERAVAVLEEGYAKTGWESLVLKMEEIRSLAAQREVLEESKNTGPSLIEFPFELEDITIKGYSLFDDYYDEVCEAFGCPAPGVENGYTLVDGNLDYSVENEYGRVGCRVDNDLKVLSILTSDGAMMHYQVFSHGQKTLEFWNSPFDWSAYGINVPVTLEDSYEDWSRIMQVKDIKERGEKTGSEISDSKEEWSFQTKWGPGVYREQKIEAGMRQELSLKGDGKYSFEYFNVIQLLFEDGRTQCYFTMK